MPTSHVLSARTQVPSARLEQVSAHLNPIMTSFDAAAVPQAPEDPLFGLMAAYRKDVFSSKVDLGIGAYRDDDAKPWVLPAVKKVRIGSIRHHFIFH